jgi:mannose-6-phosphate isomerase-like protein (cupin superfamily)
LRKRFKCTSDATQPQDRKGALGLNTGPRSQCFIAQTGVKTVPHAGSPQKMAASLTELWSPRVVAELDDMYVKVAKLHGTLGWHAHADEDELFYVLSGSLRIEMEDAAVELREGELFVVPKGVRHNPVAEQECQVMLIERKSTLHTGDMMTEKTRSLADQLRPVR